MLPLAGFSLLTACGVSQPLEEESIGGAPPVGGATSEDESTTSTAAASSTTTSTTAVPDDEGAPEIDLVEVLPTLDDLPSGFRAVKPETFEAYGYSGIDQPPDDATPECAALHAPLEEMIMIPGGSRTAFDNVDNMHLAAMAQAAHKVDMAAFEELVDLLAACPSFTRTDASETVTITVDSAMSDLGHVGYSAHMTVSSSGNGFDFSVGVTVVAAMRSDVLFVVQLGDGYVGQEVIPHDPQLALDVAAAMDAKLAELVFD